MLHKMSNDARRSGQSVVESSPCLASNPSGIQGNSSISSVQSVVEYPFWMHHARGCESDEAGNSTAKTVRDQFEQKLQKKPAKVRVHEVHAENKKLQLEQITWRTLMKIRDIQGHIDDKSISAERRASLEGQKENHVKAFLERLRKKPLGRGRDDFHAALVSEKLPLQYAYAYGPVGDLPMHTCFLLGLKDLGLKVIEEFHDTPEKINLLYIDDTLAWQVIQISQHDLP